VIPLCGQEHEDCGSGDFDREVIEGFGDLRLCIYVFGFVLHRG
jgi:hypothetical protein